ncbi:MAG: hypothetical protein VXW41_07355 [SAR324 cluster bacterium]|nr:hypothetical protein [Actinomycetota bacterium]MEC7165612.1 hypothetical protein [SAR324 cluster bacterium]
MKVKELEKGMLLEPASYEYVFSVSRWDKNPWLTVRKRPKDRLWPNGAIKKVILKNITETRFAMYVGTKRDLKIKQPWCDKFVLIDDEVVGVDPATWSRIKPCFQ